MKPGTHTQLILLTLVASALVVGGCGKQQATTGPADKTATPARDVGVNAAIVPDADLLYYLDLASMRQTPVMKQIKEKRAAAGRTAPGRMDEADWAKVQELTGLSEEDILTVLVSADLDSFNIDAPRMSKEIREVNGGAAVSLAKPLSYDKVREVMQMMSSSSPNAKLEEIELGGRKVARVIPSGPREPIVHATSSRTEMTLLIAFTEEAMADMILRDSSGQPASPDPDMIRLGSTIEEGTQMRLLLLASDTMRGKIAALIDSMADANPQQQQSQRGIVAGFLSPLRNTKNLVFWAKAADVIVLRFALELGNASEAQQCAHLLQSFVLPMLAKSFETTDPENRIKIDDSIEIADQDSSLVFTLQVTEEDVKNWQQPGS